MSKNLSLWKQDDLEPKNERKIGKRTLKNIKKLGISSAFKANINESADGKGKGHLHIIGGFGSKNNGFKFLKKKLEDALKNGPVIDRTEELREFYESKEKNNSIKPLS